MFRDVKNAYCVVNFACCRENKKMSDAEVDKLKKERNEKRSKEREEQLARKLEESKDHIDTSAIKT